MKNSNILSDNVAMITRYIAIRVVFSFVLVVIISCSFLTKANELLVEAMNGCEELRNKFQYICYFQDSEVYYEFSDNRLRVNLEKPVPYKIIAIAYHESDRTLWMILGANWAKLIGPSIPETPLKSSQNFVEVELLHKSENRIERAQLFKKIKSKTSGVRLYKLEKNSLN